MTRERRDERKGAGWGTRAVHAGLDPAAQGEPLLAGPVLAAPYHLRGPADASPYGYGRDANPTWTRLEAAIGALEEAETVAFASGMAAMSAVLLERLAPGDVLGACADGYPGVRYLVDEHLTPRGVDVRLVPTATDAFAGAAEGATLVWLETPANPGLEVADIAAVAAAAHAAGAPPAGGNKGAPPTRRAPPRP